MKTLSKRQVLALHSALIDIVLSVASGKTDRQGLFQWILAHE